MAWLVGEVLGWPIAKSVDTTSLSTSTNLHSTFPAELLDWNGFREIVTDKVRACLSRLPPGQRIHQPPPEPIIYIDSEQEGVTQLRLHCLERSSNVLKISHPNHRYVTNPRCDFLPGGRNLQRHADTTLCANARPRRALFACEVKTGKVLPANTDIIRRYHEHPVDNKVRSIVAQMTAYFEILGIEYGMLSTVEASWFCRAEQSQAGGSFVLYISEAMPFDAVNPTVTEAVYATSVMAIEKLDPAGDGFASGPRRAITFRSVEDSMHSQTTRFGRRGSVNRPAAAGSGNGGDGDGGSGSGGGGSGGGKSVHTAASLQLGAMLGMGQHAVVWEGCFASEHAAIKLVVPSLAANPDVAVASLQQELSTYVALQDLQGKSIPRLLGTGQFDDEKGHLYDFLALECIKGVSLAEGEANDGHGTAAQRALRAVHEHGYVHGDLLSSNVMLFAEPTQASAARLIDLGGSSIAESIEMQRAEELQLAALFAQQGIILEPLTPPLKQRTRRASATAV